MNAYFCVEDDLSRAVLLRLLTDLRGELHLTELQSEQGGFGFMRARFDKYWQLAKNFPVFMLTDLDVEPCAPTLRSAWMNSAGVTEPMPERFIFCVAVREVEAWVAADAENIGKFLGTGTCQIPSDTDDPKQVLLDNVRQKGSREAKSQMLPTGKSRVGLGYNTYLSRFVSEHWDFKSAAENNESLCRAIQRIQSVAAAY